MMGKRLSEMKPFEKGVIDRIECEDGAMALIEMGCCPGEEVEVAHVAPRRGPMAIVSGGRKVALRRSAAALLWVRPVLIASESVLSKEHVWA
jgi:Fe2+ transport system protein FeoA